MSDKNNKHAVVVGQTWKDNDERTGKRSFVILRVDLDYYPSGRAECKLLGRLKKGQREVFWARLNRFNGTKRGYSKLEAGAGDGATTKKKAKKKAKKSAGKR